MHLIITLLCAVFSTFLWYKNLPNDKYKISTLCWLFWGASLMWGVDAVFEYKELGAEYFSPSAADMLNDAYLGISCAVLALIIWLADLLIKDPKGAFGRKKG